MENIDPYCTSQFGYFYGKLNIKLITPILELLDKVAFCNMCIIKKNVPNNAILFLITYMTSYIVSLGKALVYTWNINIPKNFQVSFPTKELSGKKSAAF